MVKGVDNVDEAVGALQLSLYNDHATYEYINIEGVVLDSGDITCHRAISQLTYHVQNSSTANVRDCPDASCALVTSLSPGTEVTVLSQVAGKMVSGSTIWYEISIGDVHGYMHSSVLIGTPKNTDS